MVPSESSGDEFNVRPPTDYDKWLSNPYDPWVGEPLMFPANVTYDPDTKFMIEKAHADTIIDNSDIPALGTGFVEVYEKLEAIVAQRFPETDMYDLMVEWGIFESRDKTE